MRKENAIKCQRVNDIIVFAEDLALFPALGERRRAHDLLHSGQQSFMRRGKLRACRVLWNNTRSGAEKVFTPEVLLKAMVTPTGGVVGRDHSLPGSKSDLRGCDVI